MLRSRLLGLVVLALAGCEVGRSAPPAETTTITTAQVGSPTRGRLGTPSGGPIGTPSGGQIGTPSAGELGTRTASRTGTPTAGEAGSLSVGETGSPSAGSLGTPRGGEMDVAGQVAPVGGGADDAFEARMRQGLEDPVVDDAALLDVARAAPGGLAPDGLEDANGSPTGYSDTESPRGTVETRSPDAINQVDFDRDTGARAALPAGTGGVADSAGETGARGRSGAAGDPFLEPLFQPVRGGDEVFEGDFEARSPDPYRATPDARSSGARSGDPTNPATPDARSFDARTTDPRNPATAGADRAGDLRNPATPDARSFDARSSGPATGAQQQPGLAPVGPAAPVNPAPPGAPVNGAGASPAGAGAAPAGGGGR